MIEVKNLSKRYGAKQAVSGVSFTVQDGEILGFLGPNGAGKSTIMNIITGYISATEGTVTVNGTEILENPRQAKSHIGYLPEQPPLYLDMTVKEYLLFVFGLKRLRLPKQQHIQQICGLVGISDVYNRMIKNLSKGYRQRVGLAQALLGNPEVLILDEPTVGLDPKQIIEIRNLIKQLGQTHTVILSSHILSEVQAVCERVIVISNGRLLANDTPEGLARAMSGDRRLTARIAAPKEDALHLLQGLPQIQTVAELGEHEPDSFDFLLEPQPEADIRRALFSALAQKGWPLLELRGHTLSLEDIFLQLTAAEQEPAKNEEAPCPEPEEQRKNGGDAL